MPSKQPRGEALFHGYYQDLFGDRWPALQQALEGEALRIPVNDPPYYLDPASAAVARLLPLGQRNLDLCAAPGGKTLVLAGRLEEQATLTANERSQARRDRLRRVLKEHLPRDVQQRLRVTSHDARRWGLHEPDQYDAILADVPCSSERHVLADPTELARWNPRRIDRIAITQFAILAAAIDSAKPGGYVLYVTCALANRENDLLLERTLARRGHRVEVLPLDPESLAREGIRGAEKTTWGLHILPDRCNGAGPLYCSLLRRRQPSSADVPE
ncbi:16S rRNA methyltransferase RsmF [Alkalispirochaeta americana]|uniref:NOL1/NOP2/Sun domain family member 4 n=1 Tax=Alkalispirochaeta americana TaxID=159291 RepID=A0A1N6T1M6_9SPIO|nr:hypothetical protein [Alkalispirochaeta americana]SIQ47233.1 16S rRNA methyltransferase RsmF [Alkalispirochaeta americana]